jgi:exonuclease III
MIKPLKIATWNANGLAKHLQEIKTFIFSQNIDILFLKHISLTRTIAISLDIHCITQCTQ